MSARVAILLAAALLGAAVADSVLAQRSTGASGQGRSAGATAAQFRSAMPSAQVRSGAPVAGFRAPMPSTGKFAAAPGTTHIGTTHIHSGKPAFHHHKHFHHQGHKHFHHHGHKHFHHGHGTVFVTTGVVWPAYYPFHPYYPYYPAPYYGQPGPPPAVWYYCQAYGAYFPYVSECPSGWQVVQPGSY